MKKPIILLLLAFWSGSCESEGELTRDGVDVQTITPTSMLRYSGDFSATSGITVTGSANIYSDANGYKVQLEGFRISDGPDLKVYLSKAATPTAFVNLGNLTGETVYPIPTAVDVAQYPFVLIHCQQYNHLFAIAPLTEN